MRTRCALAACLAVVLYAQRAAAAFVTFESGQVRPLALTPDGRTLLAVNTPDARLEIFGVEQGSLTHRGAVSVGLEPVAVAARSDEEAWVVNHLSDSISVVDIGASPPRVVRTLLVGDEPRDIVFAGPTDGANRYTRAFITTARMGPNLPASVPPNLTTPGTARALVYVFNVADLGASVGGTPETIIELFGDTPRALAATPDGSSVYAAIFHSGNQTTTVTEGAVCDGGAAAVACVIDGIQTPGGLANGQAPGGLPAPNMNVENIAGPETGLIVKLNRAAGQWQDTLGRNWNNGVRFSLPDHDVFRLDARANPPRQVAVIPHVGTLLFNMVVHPSNGKVYVSNSEARNEVRFEGSGALGSTVRGHQHETRIAVIDGTAVTSRHLNKHIPAQPQGYRTTPMPASVKESSLATPLGLTIASDGTLYLAAFGSSKIGVFDSAALDSDTFTPSPSTHIEVSGGGPSGIALDEAGQRLYVLTRFDNAVKVVDTSTRLEIAQHPLHNPEPAPVRDGRPFLYDARFTSSNGEASCATCHMFADFDSLAWDLGNPDEHVHENLNPLGPTGFRQPFHPLKGPMTTQTLRGMARQGPMHWRGDRSGSEFIEDPRALDSDLAFKKFNVAFDALLGRDEGELSAADMDAFTDFILQVMPPPNPVRALDNQLTAAQAEGRRIFLDDQFLADDAAHCAGCHTLSPRRGEFGTLGQSTFDDEPQEFKVPQLKNMYQKIGMFGTPHTHFADIRPEHSAFQGDQIRGFGFLHDGSTATVFDFLRAVFFHLNDDQRRALEQYMFVFETTFAPIVGQQITLTQDNATLVGPRIDLLRTRAETPFVLVDHPGARECELIAKAVIGGVPRGYLYDPEERVFRSDRAAEPAIDDGALRALASVTGQHVTYTCAPPSEGRRLGVDRDADGHFDRDEIDTGTDPTDPNDPIPLPPTATPSRTPTITRTPTTTATPSTYAPGDADCNHRIDSADIDATCTGIFDRRARIQCPASDCDEDGAVTAADVSCVLHLIVNAAMTSDANRANLTRKRHSRAGGDPSGVRPLLNPDGFPPARE